MRLNLNPQNGKVRALLWTAAAVVLPLALLAGYITVTKNCYNAMNETPMTVFGTAKTDSGETVVIFLNETYILK